MNNQSSAFALQVQPGSASVRPQWATSQLFRQRHWLLRWLTFIIHFGGFAFKRASLEARLEGGFALEFYWLYSVNSVLSTFDSPSPPPATWQWTEHPF
jgi:hypothetical protein